MRGVAPITPSFAGTVLWSAMNEKPVEKPAAAAMSLRHRPGGFANANLNSKGGIHRSEKTASARSAAKSKPWSGAKP